MKKILHILLINSTVAKTIDYFVADEETFSFFIQAIDNGGKYSLVGVNINVISTTIHLPVFEKSIINVVVPEDIAVGYKVSL